MIYSLRVKGSDQSSQMAWHDTGEVVCKRTQICYWIWLYVCFDVHICRLHIPYHS